MQSHLKLVSNQEEPHHDISKEKASKAFESMEKQRLKQRLLLGTGLGSAGLAGIGGWKGSKVIAGTGLSAAFIAGLMHGKSKREEGISKQKLKRHIEKRAVLVGSLHAVAHTVFPEIASMVPPEIVAGADLAILPWLAGKAGQGNRDSIHAVSKNIMGLPLEGNERKVLSDALSTESRLQRLDKKFENFNPANPFGYAALKFRDKIKSYFGIMPSHTGGHIGEIAGPVLREFRKFSPTLADAALEASRSNEGVNLLKEELLKRKSAYSGAGDILKSIPSEVPGLETLLRATGKGGQGLANKLLEHPEEAINMANALKKNVVKGVSAGKGISGALALGLLGHGIGRYGRLKKIDSNLDQVVSEETT